MISDRNADSWKKKLNKEQHDEYLRKTEHKYLPQKEIKFQVIKHHGFYVSTLRYMGYNCMFFYC